ncbi:MAG TPA: hypothetical protein VMM18_06055, partial [Gemmatimonadaceae bacterium]|nr:hypothetical protein [Gemmatimonadaceae bacterium]
MTGSDRHEPNDGPEFSLTEPASAPSGEATPENIQADAKTLGKTIGGFAGGVGGLSIGALGGPVGAAIGAIAGAVGGWWAGRGVALAISDQDDAAYRAHYESDSAQLADRRYEDLRPAYLAGHLAGRNPDYAGRSFDEVEGDLRRGWTADVARQCGDWTVVRRYARAGFDGARTTSP